MTRDEAFAKAIIMFGERAVIGSGAVPKEWELGFKYWVGVTVKGEWIWRGVGDTWEEAFENVKSMKTTPHVDVVPVRLRTKPEDKVS